MADRQQAPDHSERDPGAAPAEGSVRLAAAFDPAAEGSAAMAAPPDTDVPRSAPPTQSALSAFPPRSRIRQARVEEPARFPVLLTSALVGLILAAGLYFLDYL